MPAVHFDRATGGTDRTVIWTGWNDAWSEVTNATTTATNNWITTTGTSTTSTIWTVWTGTSTGGLYVAQPQAYTPPPETPAQRAAREAEHAERMERYERERRARAAAREIANRKAEELLLGNLTQRQREEFERHRHFVVVGRSGMRYRIREGRTANIDVIDQHGNAIRRLCAHPAEDVPNFDTMLAQRLMLETAEDEFVRLANAHPRPAEHLRLLPPMH